jgi:hypothetical protein
MINKELRIRRILMVNEERKVEDKEKQKGNHMEKSTGAHAGIETKKPFSVEIQHGAYKKYEWLLDLDWVSDDVGKRGSSEDRMNNRTGKDDQET